MEQIQNNSWDNINLKKWFGVTSSAGSGFARYLYFNGSRDGQVVSISCFGAIQTKRASLLEVLKSNNLIDFNTYQFDSFKEAMNWLVENME